MGRKKKALPDYRIGSSYGWTTYSVDDWTRRLQRIAVKIELLQETHKIDALALRGSSGMMAGAVLSVALQMPVIYVRKPGEYAHGGPVESNSREPIKSYLIVDDFIDSGSTIREIVDAIDRDAEEERSVAPKCVGVLLYNDYSITTKSVKIGKDLTVPIFK